MRLSLSRRYATEETLPSLCYESVISLTGSWSAFNAFMHLPGSMRPNVIAEVVKKFKNIAGLTGVIGVILGFEGMSAS